MIKNYAGILVVVLMMACSNKENKPAATNESTATEKEINQTTVVFSDAKVAGIYSDYIGLKDALVASQFEEAKQKAKLLTATLKAYPGCENTAILSGKIEDAKDISEQRKSFTGLSTDVIALFKHAELKQGAIYVQHCPMANEGNGGDWLASEKKIQNPYYGSEMMECGAVTEEIRAK